MQLAWHRSFFFFSGTDDNSVVHEIVLNGLPDAILSWDFQFANDVITKAPNAT